MSNLSLHQARNRNTEIPERRREPASGDGISFLNSTWKTGFYVKTSRPPAAATTTAAAAAASLAAALWRPCYHPVFCTVTTSRTPLVSEPSLLMFY